jgi:hypothetical protein
MHHKKTFLGCSSSHQGYTFLSSLVIESFESHIPSSASITFMDIPPPQLVKQFQMTVGVAWVLLAMIILSIVIHSQDRGFLLITFVPKHLFTLYILAAPTQPFLSKMKVSYRAIIHMRFEVF